MAASSIFLALINLLKRIHSSSENVLSEAEHELNRVELGRVLRSCETHELSVLKIGYYFISAVNSCIVHDEDYPLFKLSPRVFSSFKSVNLHSEHCFKNLRKSLPIVCSSSKFTKVDSSVE